MAKAPRKEPEQTIEVLKDRYRELNEQKIKVQTQRDDALDRVNRLKNEALEKFGTDDLGELQQKLADMKSQNQKRRITYQKNLDQIEQKLAEVNENFFDDEQLDDAGLDDEQLDDEQLDDAGLDDEQLDDEQLDDEQLDDAGLDGASIT